MDAEKVEKIKRVCRTCNTTKARYSRSGSARPVARYVRTDISCFNVVEFEDGRIARREQT